MKKYLNREDVLFLHSIGMNDNEIARELHASVNGIRYIRKDVLNLPHNVRHYQITDEMEDVIIGTLLGDAWVGYVHSQCRYPKYQLTHCQKQYEYLRTIHSILRPIMPGSIKCVAEPKEIIIKGKKTRRQAHFTISSRNCDALVKYRDIFYKEDKKIIPVNFLQDKINAKILAYWYMDDGSYDINAHSYIINTQCFSRSNLQEFVDLLCEKFDLHFSIKKDCSLYLRHRSNVTFENLIRKHLTSDMQYKIVSSLNPVKRGNPSINEGNPVLNLLEIKENA